MATVDATKIEASHVDPVVLLYEWVMASGDDGEAVSIPHNTDIVVQVLTMTGATVTWEGSLSTGTPVWGAVHKVDGTVVSQTVAGQIDQILESPLIMRPKSAAGPSTVRLKATKQWSQ
jgi:hypothetical protein